MLKKLMKHEWKNISKVGGIVLLVILGLTISGYLFLRFSPLIKLMESDDPTVGWIYMMVAIIGFFTYCIACCGATYGMIFYTGFRFYRTMYSEQGYLTHTLPVTSGQLLASKLLISGCWTVITYIAVVLSVFALFAGAINGSSDSVTIWAIFNDMAEGLRETGMPMVKIILYYLQALLLCPFVMAMQIFGCLTIGQLSKKHKVLVGILVYIGLLFVNYIISMVAQVISMVKLMSDMAMPNGLNMDYLFASSYVSLGVNYLAAIVLGIVSYRIIKNKLNLS